MLREIGVPRSGEGTWRRSRGEEGGRARLLPGPVSAPEMPPGRAQTVGSGATLAGAKLVKLWSPEPVLAWAVARRLRLALGGYWQERNRGLRWGLTLENELVRYR